MSQYRKRIEAVAKICWSFRKSFSARACTCELFFAIRKSNYTWAERDRFWPLFHLWQSFHESLRTDMFGSCLNIKHFGWIFFGSFTVSLRKCSFVRKIQTSKISLEIHYNRLNHWANIFICCSFQIVSFIVKAKVFSGKYSNVARAAQEKRKFQTLN